MLAIANCQHSYSYVLPFVNEFLDVTNYDVNKSFRCANLAVEYSIGKQQALTVVGYETTIARTLKETCPHCWAMSHRKSLVKVAWTWMTVVEVTIVKATLHFVLYATHITMTNSLCGGRACATH